MRISNILDRALYAFQCLALTMQFSRLTLDVLVVQRCRFTEQVRTYSTLRIATQAPLTFVW